MTGVFHPPNFTNQAMLGQAHILAGNAGRMSSWGRQKDWAVLAESNESDGP